MGMEASNTPPVHIRPEVLAVPAYKQGATPEKKGYKLSSNENPFPPLPAVQRAIAEAQVNRYANAALPELKAKIGELYGLDPATSMQRVHVGAGSVSILYQLVQATVAQGDNFIYPWPSFEGYPMLALVAGGEGRGVRGNDDGTHNLDAMADAIDERTRAIMVCTPNNPTGPIVTKQQFANFMQRVPSNVLVVLDEAYAEFVTDPEAVRGDEEVGKYENLVVLRTFSKAYGLAGLRAGYGVGHPMIWEACRVVGIPLSVSPQAEAAALASLETESTRQLKENIAVLVERRERLVQGLRDQGYEVAESQSNFVWLPLRDNSQELALAFAEQGTLVRNFAGEGVRISVGEEESTHEVLRITAAFQQGA